MRFEQRRSLIVLLQKEGRPELPIGPISVDSDTFLSDYSCFMDEKRC